MGVSPRYLLAKPFAAYLKPLLKNTKELIFKGMNGNSLVSKKQNIYFIGLMSIVKKYITNWEEGRDKKEITDNLILDQWAVI